MTGYTLGPPLPVPKPIRALYRQAEKACRDVGLRVPRIKLRWVDRITNGEGYEVAGLTWTSGRVVHVVLTPCDVPGDVMAHEMAHAVLEPIFTPKAQHHNSLWAQVYRVLYVALVDDA